VIEGEVDGGKFDMDDGVEQPGPAFRCARIAVGNVFVRQQFRLAWAAAKQCARRGVAPVEFSSLPVGCDGGGQLEFLVNIGNSQRLGQAGEKCIHQGAGLV